ncbi:MAG: hypothetical protein RIF37_17540 [Rhodospirillaceae bacterium]
MSETLDQQNEDQANREMFEEIAALMGGISRAFELDEGQAISAVESGEIQMSFETDSNGKPYVLATHGEKTARLYSGAIKQETVANH